MNTQITSAAPQHQDLGLRGTMAVVGLVLLGLSLLILTRDLVQAAVAVWLFRASAGLGLLTLLSACLPSRIP